MAVTETTLEDVKGEKDGGMIAKKMGLSELEREDAYIRLVCTSFECLEKAVNSC